MDRFKTSYLWGREKVKKEKKGLNFIHFFKASTALMSDQVKTSLKNLIQGEKAISLPIRAVSRVNIELGGSSQNLPNSNGSSERSEKRLADFSVDPIRVLCPWLPHLTLLQCINKAGDDGQ